MRDDQPNTLVYAAAGLIAVASAIACSVALNQAVKPSDFADRLSVVNQQIAGLEAAAKLPPLPAGYGGQAACRRGDAAEIAEIEQRISQSVEAAGANLGNVAVTALDSASERLIPLQVKVEANGSYDKIVALMAGLSQNSPSLFVDRLDLRQGGGGVQLVLSSKVFCWNDARS